MEHGLTKQEIFSHLIRSGHADKLERKKELKAVREMRRMMEYAPIAAQAARTEPEFLAHLISWNQLKGEVRLSKVAIPVASLAWANLERVYAENSVAHVLLQSPEDMIRALRMRHAFVGSPSHEGLSLPGAIRRWLKHLENSRGRWERVAIMHRRSLQSLYALTHTKPCDFAYGLFEQDKYKRLPLFQLVRELPNMPAVAAAGAIVEHKIPTMVVLGALNVKTSPDLALALIERMTPSELMSNMKLLEGLGVKTNPALRGSLDAALKRATDSKGPASKRATMKAQTAAVALGDSELATKVRAVGEKQMDRISIDGDWAVLADRSPSMEQAVEVSRWLASTLARLVKGRVHLIFFDGDLHKYLEVTGKTLEEIHILTRGMKAGGSGTSIGVGLSYLRDKGISVNGIAIVSDGGENRVPYFPDEYPRYCAFVGRDVPVYLYWLKGTSDDVLSDNMQRRHIEMQKFNANNVDAQSLPTLVQTMRTSRYGLIEQVMESPLLTLDEVLG